MSFDYQQRSRKIQRPVWNSLRMPAAVVELGKNEEESNAMFKCSWEKNKRKEKG